MTASIGPAVKVKAKLGSEKYWLGGMNTEDSFANLHIDHKWGLLVEGVNHGLSQGTWSSHKSALKSLKACETETGKCMNFPL